MSKETFYDRLLVETQELATKLNGLNSFIGYPRICRFRS